MNDLIWPIGAMVLGAALLIALTVASVRNSRTAVERDVATIRAEAAEYAAEVERETTDHWIRTASRHRDSAEKLAAQLRRHIPGVTCSDCFGPTPVGMEHYCRAPLSRDVTAVMRAVGLGEEQR